MKRLLSVMLAVFILASAIQPIQAKTANSKKMKTVWVIESDSLDSNTYMKCEYNSKGLLSAYTYEMLEGARCEFTYNKENLLIKQDTGLTTTKYKYSGNAVKKAVVTTPGGKQTVSYKWKKNNTKCTVKYQDYYSVVFTFDKNKNMKEYVKKEPIGSRTRTSTVTFKYNKKGQLVKTDAGYLVSTLKNKTNKKGNITKVVITQKIGSREEKEVWTYKYKKISVPASTYDLVMKQQQYLRYWMQYGVDADDPELAMLTALG